MSANHHPGVLAICLAPITCITLALTGCVADGGQSPAGPQLASGASQTRPVTYNCGEEGALTVMPMSSAVHLVDTQGASYDLPASPPTQTSRFGEGSVALVVEESEALWMKAGQEPVTCRR